MSAAEHIAAAKAHIEECQPIGLPAATIHALLAIAEAITETTVSALQDADSDTARLIDLMEGMNTARAHLRDDPRG